MEKRDKLFSQCNDKKDKEQDLKRKEIKNDWKNELKKKKR